MGWNAQPTCAVVMDHVKIPDADRLGAEGAGFSIAMNACEYIVYDGRACCCGPIEQTVLARLLSHVA